MEKFQQIDWTTNVEDIIDEKFLNEKRLENESAMYKIMNGHFHDPFQHLRRFTVEKQEPKSPAKQQPKKLPKKPSLGVAVKIKRRGRPRKNISKDTIVQKNSS